MGARRPEDLSEFGDFFPFAQAIVARANSSMGGFDIDTVNDTVTAEREMLELTHTNFSAYLAEYFQRFETNTPYDADERSFDHGALFGLALFQEQARRTGIPLPPFPDDPHSEIASEQQRMERIQTERGIPADDFAACARSYLTWMMVKGGDDVVPSAVFDRSVRIYTDESGIPDTRKRASFIVGAVAAYVPYRRMVETAEMTKLFSVATPKPKRLP